VVPGWQEALPLMKVGSKWRVWLPPELGYGDAGSPPAIEPNEVLVFEIELLAIPLPDPLAASTHEFSLIIKRIHYDVPFD
jgi:hypothetical protein